MPAGRPTTYKKKYCKKVDDYIKRNQDEWRDTNTGEKKLIVNLPTTTGFSLFVNIPQRTLYEWRDKHPEFSQSLEKIVKEQKKRLIDMGLSGDYNSTIAKLILSSNHGMREKTDTDLTTQGEKIIPIYGGHSISRHNGNEKDIQTDEED